MPRQSRSKLFVRVRIVLVAHVVEGPHRRRVVGDEHELAARRARRSAPRARARSAGRGRGRRPARSWPASRSSSLACSSVTRGNGSSGTSDLGAEGLAIRSPWRLVDRGEHVGEPALLDGHHVLVRVDPGELHVDARELGVVARGERRVGAEHGADLEHLAEARPPSPSACRTAATGRGRRRSRSSRRGTARRRTRWPSPSASGSAARRTPPARQNSRIACSTRVCTSKISFRSGTAQVEVAPVDPLVQRGVLGDRQLGLGEPSRPSSDSIRSSRPPSFTRSSADDGAGDGHGRLGASARRSPR